MIYQTEVKLFDEILVICFSELLYIFLNLQNLAVSFSLQLRLMPSVTKYSLV